MTLKPHLYTSRHELLGVVPEWLSKACKTAETVPFGSASIPNGPEISVRLHRIRPNVFAFALCSPQDDQAYALWMSEQFRKAKTA